MERKYKVKKVLYEDYFGNKSTKKAEISQQRSASAGRRRPQTGKIIQCASCGEVFIGKGTRKYCYGDFCKNEEKRKRQSLVDELVAQIKKGLYSNYKILRELQPKSGESKIEYDVVLKKGFDEHAYYGTYINSHRDIWHIVGEYYFTISHEDDNRFLHIYKK